MVVRQTQEIVRARTRFHRFTPGFALRRPETFLTGIVAPTWFLLIATIFGNSRPQRADRSSAPRIRPARHKASNSHPASPGLEWPQPHQDLLVVHERLQPRSRD